MFLAGQAAAFSAPAKSVHDDQILCSWWLNFNHCVVEIQPLK
jgi:hypothetical protein